MFLIQTIIVLRGLIWKHQPAQLWQESVVKVASWMALWESTDSIDRQTWELVPKESCIFTMRETNILEKSAKMVK